MERLSELSVDDSLIVSFFDDYIEETNMDTKYVYLKQKEYALNLTQEDRRRDAVRAFLCPFFLQQRLRLFHPCCIQRKMQGQGSALPVHFY